MRTHGTLAKWHDDRGFGFISSAAGTEEIFVHISAFPRDGVRPRLNELISFETKVGPNGKRRAVRVMRPGSQRSRPAVAGEYKPRSRLAGAIPGAVFIVAMCAYGYSSLNQPAPPVVAHTLVTEAPDTPTSGFKCDGRTMCSQMTSCTEAQYFLQHCPNTQMDGNNDGEPCEQQWCR